jgi:hypothetical protein
MLGRLHELACARAPGPSGSRPIGKLVGRAMLLLALLAASCQPKRPPPARLLFGGLPVSGDLGFAQAKGFKSCFNVDAMHMRCRRHDVMFLGQGPFEAAVDLLGGYGQSGFDQLTLWHDSDNEEVYKILVSLAKMDWRYCYTGDGDRGDQAIFTRQGEKFRISMDISYWAKRRLRVIPNWNKSGLGENCVPDGSLLRFGRDVARAAGQ